jgi:pyruvate dehydrogenase E1 component alpha subunit
MGTPVDRASAVHEIYRRACAYDMEAARIDGNNLLEVMQKTADFVEKTRSDSEPRFIEAVCYRFKGHSVIDPDKYRSDEEKQQALKGDPVVYFEHQLREARLVDDNELQRIHQEVDNEVEETVRFADQSPDPPKEELYKFLYAGEWGQRANG